MKIGVRRLLILAAGLTVLSSCAQPSTIAAAVQARETVQVPVAMGQRVIPEWFASGCSLRCVLSGVLASQGQREGEAFASSGGRVAGVDRRAGQNLRRRRRRL